MSKKSEEDAQAELLPGGTPPKSESDLQARFPSRRLTMSHECRRAATETKAKRNQGPSTDGLSGKHSFETEDAPVG